MELRVDTLMLLALLTALCGCRTVDSAARSGDRDNLGRFNVRVFGAKGDGQTDDTRSFQAGLDAAARVSGTVFVPAGTYRVGRLVWHDCTHCQGARLNGLSLVGRNLGTNLHGIRTKPHETNEKPGKWEREDFPASERCMIRGFTGNGLDMDVWCLSLRACAIGYNRGNGFNSKHADALVIDNWLSNNQGAGIRAVQGTGSSTFAANRIEWNRGGNMVVRNAWGWSITGNSFDRGKELAQHERCAVRLVGVDGLTFTGNSITVGGNDASMQQTVPTPECGLIVHKLSNAVISGNRLAGTKQALLDLGEHGEQVIIKDNVIQITPTPASATP